MIKLNNKEYRFKFGFKATLNYENEEGVSISELGSNFKMQNLVDMAYHAITAAGDTITKDEIVDAIDQDPSLINTITKAVEKDMAAFNLIEEEAKK